MTVGQEERRSALLVLLVLVWITVTLFADAGGTDFAQQRLLGLLAWALLLALLRGEPHAVRVQVLVAVAFATLAELTGSVLLGAYTYRLENIPAYVPPGHGLIYLAAVAGAHTRIVRQNIPSIRWAALLVCGAWSAWGVLFSSQTDWLGAALFAVFAACLFVWKSPGVYALAFAITTHLELLGTALGNWTWAAQAGWLSAGNPPSAVVAGYCVIDAVALVAGGWLAARTAPMHLLEPAAATRARPRGRGERRRPVPQARLMWPRTPGPG